MKTFILIIIVIILNLLAGYLIGWLLNVLMLKSKNNLEEKNLPEKIFDNQFKFLSFWLGFIERASIIAALVISKGVNSVSLGLIAGIYVIVALPVNRDDKKSNYSYELVIIGQLLTAWFAFGIWYLIFKQ